METFTVTFTAHEGDTLLRLIDLAVRQGGISVAEPALVISSKIQSSVQQAIAHRGNGRDADALATRP